MPVRRLVRTPALRVLATLSVLVGGVVAAVPAAASPTTPATAVTATADEPGGLVLVPRPRTGEVGIQATIENEEAFCGVLGGVYVSKPTWYTVRTINCRHTDVFVKGRYANGTFGTCVLVPARHSRHLGGSLLKPMEDSQIC
jgi:hypothetical protein